MAMNSTLYNNDCRGIEKEIVDGLLRIVEGPNDKAAIRVI